MLDFNHKYYEKENNKSNKNESINSLIDFSFPSMIKKIKQTRDDSFLIGYGEYPPQIRCFDLYNLGLKFQRTIDCSVKDFQVISENWEKLVLLRSDKFIEFHSKSGYYYQIKIPEIGSSILFDNQYKILYIPATHSEIFKFNLELGKFISSIKTNSIYTNTSITKNFPGDLLGLGNSKGIVEIWDLRTSQKPVSIINGLQYLKKKESNMVTCLSFCKTTNYKFYIGFSSGEIIYYDLRNSTPIICKNMGNDLPIKTIKKNQNSNLILCADQRLIKIWNEINGKTLECIRPKNQINHICLLKNTGFIFTSTTGPRVDTRYISLLGPMPKWSFPLNYHRKEKFFEKRENYINIKKKKTSYNKISMPLNRFIKSKQLSKKM